MTEVRVPFDLGHRKPGESPEPPRRPARIARTLALAHNLQRRLDGGEFFDYADMARQLGFTRARITQIMALLLLAPGIQEEILLALPQNLWVGTGRKRQRRIDGGGVLEQPSPMWRGWGVGRERLRDERTLLRSWKMRFRRTVYHEGTECYSRLS
jgi:hypothetical protein